MRLLYLSFCLLLGTVSTALAQTFNIKGRVTDRATGEGLPGTSVIINGTTQGGVTDGGGSFTIGNVKPGSYTLKATYIGYVALEQKVTVTNRDETVTFRLAEDNTTLNEVEVVAQVAVERETPVAFSTVNEVRLRESLAGRDLPLILNETPGVYATQSGGGAGDSRISIRGFDQRNVAVMINGVPVNDMENGAVYWSNWDLGDVTKNLQVQRGLTASKLAVPSVGGTINVLTRGFDAKQGGRFRQEIGFNDFDKALPRDLGYFKTSLMLSTGQLKGDWAMTVFASRRTNTGWVDKLYDDAWTYFANVSKRLGKHQLSLTVLGSPQSHGQRSFAQPIGSYSKKRAEELGDTVRRVERGYRFNIHWDNVNRYKLNADGTQGPDNYEIVNERENYYHKPQANLNHFWNVSDKLFISNVVYASTGNGGGIGSSTTSGLGTKPETGTYNLQRVYDTNIRAHETIRTVRALDPQSGTPTNYTDRDPESFAQTHYLRSSVNNHKWVGFITSADYKLNENATLSAGIDGRYYRGEHYQEVYDLLGADYTLDFNATFNQRTTPINTFNGAFVQGNNNTDDVFRKLRKGDKIRYNYDGITKWIGGYTQLEYKKGPLAGFVSATASQVSYQRIDYFRARPYTLPDGRTIQLGAGLTEVPKLDANGQPIPNQVEYYTRNQTVVVSRASSDYPNPLPVGQENGIPTTITLDVPYGQSVTYNGRTYRSVDARNVGNVTSGVVRLPGFTVKTGANYNLTEDNNIFVNVGYLSRAQFFNYVFTQNGDRIADPKNENIFSVELGYAISRPGFKAALNAYRTYWYNKSTTVSATDANGEPRPTNVSGLDALHQGIELDIAQEITRQLSLNAAFSIGDWRWASKGTYRITNENNEEIGTGTFNPKGVHVGGSAQNQFMVGIRYEPLTGLYVRPTFTLFTKNYAEFNAEDLEGENPQDALRLPTSRNVDLHMGYSFEVRGGEHVNRVSLNGSVLNVFNEFFITDAPTGGTRDPFNPSQTPVFFNLGRRMTLGLTVDF